MSKIELPEVGPGNSGRLRTNDNFRKIEEALNDKVLFRDNPPGEPNEMNNDLDMNSNRVYNLPVPTLDHEATPWGEVKGGVPAAKKWAEEAKESAIESAESADESASSALVATQQANRAESEADRAEDAADSISGAIGRIDDLEDAVDQVEVDLGNKVDKDSQVFFASDYGAVGDDVVNDTSALSSLFSSVPAGSTIRLGQNKVYRVTHGALTLPDYIEIESNGSSFHIVDQTGTTYAMTFGGNFTADSINILVDKNPIATAQRGILFSKGNIRLGSLSITASDVETGKSNSSSVAGVAIGPLLYADRASNVDIGSIHVFGYDRPVIFQNLTNVHVGRLDMITYLRGVYIKNCINMTIDSGYGIGNSPGIQSNAGENTLLIESADTHRSTRSIHINNFVSDMSGEHGFRIGGGLVVSDVWFTNCLARNSGAGSGVVPSGNGGCGFKVLGPTVMDNAFHENINYLNCTAERSTQVITGNGYNFAGLYMGKARNVTVTGFKVLRGNQVDGVTPNTGYSAYNGVAIIGCRDVEIINPIIENTESDGVYVFDFVQAGFFWDRNKNIRVTGGQIISPGRYALSTVAGSTTMENILFENVFVEGGLAAFRPQLSGSGSYLNCKAGFTCVSPSSGTPFTGAGTWLIEATGPAITETAPCLPGSIYKDLDSGTIKVRDVGRWSSLNGTYTFTVADDTSASFTPPKRVGWISVSSATPGQQGMLYFVGISGGLVATKNSSGPNFDVTTTALSGTTGTDGNTTVGITAVSFWIENRSGSSQTYYLTFM